jgi:hypothetical protein
MVNRSWKMVVTIGACAALTSVVCSCQQAPSSPEEAVAIGMARLSRMPHASSAESVEAALHLSQFGLQITRYVDLVRWDPARPDAIINGVVIDNIYHSGPMQEITVALNKGTCVTEQMLRRATGVSAKPYEVDWIASPHIPPHYTPPPSHDLDFTIADRAPTDERKVLLRGDPQCYSVIVVKKYWKE